MIEKTEIDVDHRAFDIALKKIDACLKRGGQSLSLSGLGLTELPSQIGQLTKLTSLNLSGNKLTILPPAIGGLKSLRKLKVSNNNVHTLPPDIGLLERLIELDLEQNQLRELPAEIGQLKALQILDLGENQIRALPPEIGQLEALLDLNLTQNELFALSAELCQLTSLIMLFVGHNNLTDIPNEIGKLSKLAGLYLHNNNLSALPPDLGRLQALRILVLSSNKLRALPAEFGQLKALEELLAPDNEIATLPLEGSGLVALRVVDLASNKLKKLPNWLGNLAKLKILLLHGNPGLELSNTVLGPDPIKESKVPVSARSILDFYFGTRIGKTRPLNEVKLIMVGRGGAGKTSTVRALQGLPFNDDEVSTPGIALCDWTMDGCKKLPVIAHIWDFAGQVITHALHQFFFSMRSVYVVVLTGRENNEREDAEYWLRLIKAFGTDESGNGPPVVVALNKWDLAGCRPSVDRGALQERYPFIQSFVEIDCQSNKGIAKLKTVLCREVDQLKWVREPFPEAWDKVRRALTTGRKKRAHLSYIEYRALCAENGVIDEGQQDSLAEILHHLGAALNYRNDPRLREATVLQPEWLTKNVYGLVRRAEKQAGVLTQSDVDSVLRAEKDQSMRAYLVQIMERFEIAYAPRAKDEHGGTWLVPQALHDQQPKDVAAFRDAADATRLRYTYPALPEGLVARAIVRLNEFIEDVDGVKQQWASGVILRRETARALIRTEAQDRQVTITVTGPNKVRQQLAGLCQAEMRDIHAEIRGLDPIEETQVRGTWVATLTLELDERNRKQTGVATKDQGTVMIDPTLPNNAYSAKLARSDDVWKPTVFISYSKSNVNQRKRLESELKILKNEGLLAAVWHDRMIDPGVDWDYTIQKELEGADVVIILASSAALATEYITKQEIPKALELHTADKTVVVPVILEACRWDKTALGALNALPEKGKALNKWKPQSDGWNSVADGLANVCTKLMKKGGTLRLKRINIFTSTK